MDNELITQAEFATRIQVKPPYITKLIKQGIIKLRNGKVDAMQAQKAVDAFRGPAHTGKTGRPAKGINGDDDVRYLEYRALREQIKYANEKLDYEERLGELVSVEKVKKDAFGLARQVRDSILNIPDRMGVLTHEQKEALRKELLQALEALSEPG